MFAHIDCDCFFVSVELIKKPWLKGKPVCVAGPHKDAGVVVSASYEARPFGIRAGTPVFKARQLCPDAIFISGGMSKYTDLSKQLFNYFHQISPAVEHMSIDEGFLDLRNLDRIYNCSWQELAMKIQKQVLSHFKIPISIGIAPTKTLAKLGSKYQKPFGITVISNENREQILKKVAIKDICGIGYRSISKVHLVLGVRTAWEFTQLSAANVKQLLGLPGLVIWHELNSVKLRNLSTERTPPQSILRSSMFDQKSKDPNLIHNSLCARLEEALKKLQRYDLKAQQLTVFLRKKHPSKASVRFNLLEPQNELTAFLPYLKQSLRQIYNPQINYRAAGVYLTHLTPNLIDKQELPLEFSEGKQNCSTDFIRLLREFDQKLGKNQVLTLSRLKQAQRKPDADLAFVG